eukprot:60017_1
MGCCIPTKAEHTTPNTYKRLLTKNENLIQKQPAPASNISQDKETQIFKQKATHCFAESKHEPNIDNCDFLNRLTHALKYYQSLDVSDVNKFMEFKNMYGEALNDYIHCIHTHGTGN